MADKLTVSKLVSTFGFQIEPGAVEKVEAEIAKLKKKLASVEANVLSKSSKEAKKVADKTNKDIQDAHVKHLDAKHKAEARSLRRLRALEKSEAAKRFKEQAEIFQGKATRTKTSVQRVIDEQIVGKKNPDLVRTADLYRQEELAVRKEIARLEKEAYKEQAVRDAAKKKSAQEELRLFKQKLRHLSDEARINRGINRLNVIRAEYTREKLLAQDRLNRGLMTQTQYEERINQLIARRRMLAAQVRDGGSVGGASSGSMARDAGLLAGASKIGKGIVPQLAAGGAAFGSVFAVQSLFQGTMQIEQFDLAVKSITGSAEAAREELEFFRETAERTGVSLTGGLDAYKSYFVSMKAAKQDVDVIRDSFEAMSDAAVVYGLSQDQVNGVLRAFGQIAGKNKLMAEELTQQLGDRLYGAVSLTAEGMGITTEELYAMMQAGEVSAAKFFPAITKSLRDMTAQAGDTGNTLPLIWNKFMNTIREINHELYEMGFADDLKEIVKNLTEFVSGLKVVLVPAISVATKALKGMSDLIGSENVGMVFGFLLLAGAIGKVGKALSALSLPSWLRKSKKGDKKGDGLGVGDAAGLLGLFGLFGGKGMLAGAAKGVVGFFGLLSAKVLIVVGAVSSLFLILEDIYVLMTGGKSLIGKWFGDQESVRYIENVLKTITNVFTSTFDAILSIPSALGDMLVDVGNAIASTVEEAFNAVAEKWNWLKSKIPFLGGDIEPSGYASPVDQSTAAPTTAKVLRVGAQNVAKKIKSAGDEKPVWDKAGGESFQSYQDKLSVWEALNKGKSVASAAQKYGVQKADGGMYYSEAIAKQGQRGYEFMQNMGAPAAELALAKQQLAKQGGQPVVNQEIKIQVDGSKDPMFTSKIIRQELERVTGAGIQSTPAGYN